eukprot:gene7543-15450_t
MFLINFDSFTFQPSDVCLQRLHINPGNDYGILSIPDSFPVRLNLPLAICPSFLNYEFSCSSIMHISKKTSAIKTPCSLLGPAACPIPLRGYRKKDTRVHRQSVVKLSLTKFTVIASRPFSEYLALSSTLIAPPPLQLGCTPPLVARRLFNSSRTLLLMPVRPHRLKSVYIDDTAAFMLKLLLQHQCFECLLVGDF